MKWGNDSKTGELHSWDLQFRAAAGIGVSPSRDPLDLNTLCSGVGATYIVISVSGWLTVFVGFFISPVMINGEIENQS